MKPQPSRPHPGEVLKTYLADLPISAAAAAIGVSRSTLSRILSGQSRISSDVASRLGEALGTSPAFWEGLQFKFDQRGGAKSVESAPRSPIKRNSPQGLQGMGSPPPSRKRSIKAMQVEFAREMAVWESAPPVGREFGSPDYDRLAELDNLAWRARGSMLKARRWLDTPHPDLDGLAPEAVAKTKTGHQRVLRLLRRMIKGKT